CARMIAVAETDYW
nr:immunoglobulin heavy chain junction region [Macaca mulatta]MOV51161.1 immunoglobulin heavy chain junction region [Macaca mulatta]MOV51341.1 immunoglobulin heavy chain junction region [Macaca mulatta]MOV51607.1 immunoglobulin heavy chain junction region [Macaca mulatta]